MCQPVPMLRNIRQLALTPDIGSSSTYASDHVSTGSYTNALNHALGYTCAPELVPHKSTG